MDKYTLKWMRFLAYPERFYKAAKFAASLAETKGLHDISLGELYNQARNRGKLEMGEGGPYTWDYRVAYILRAVPSRVYRYLGQYARDNDLERKVSDIWTKEMVKAIQGLSGHSSYYPRLEEDYDIVLEKIGETARKTGRYNFLLCWDLEELHGLTIPYTTMMEIVYRTILVSKFLRPKFYENYKDVVHNFIKYIIDPYMLPQRWGAPETGIPRIPKKVEVKPIPPPRRGNEGEPKYTFNQFLSSLYGDLLSKFENGLEYDMILRLLRLPEFYRKSTLYTSNATAIQGLLNPEGEYRKYFPSNPKAILDIGCGPNTFFECADMNDYGRDAIKNCIDLSSVLDYLEARFEVGDRYESSSEPIPMRKDGVLFGLFPDGYSKKEIAGKEGGYDLVICVSFLDQMMPAIRLYTSLLLIAVSLSKGGKFVVVEPHDLRKRVGKDDFKISLDEYVFTLLEPILGNLGFEIEVNEKRSFAPISGEELLFSKRYSFLFAKKKEEKDLNRDLLSSLILSNLWSISKASTISFSDLKKIVKNTLKKAKTNLAHRKRILIGREYGGWDDRARYEQFIRNIRNLRDQDIKRALEALNEKRKKEEVWIRTLLEEYEKSFGEEILVPTLIGGEDKIAVQTTEIRKFLKKAHKEKIDEILKKIEKFSPPLCNFEILDVDRVKLEFLTPVKSYKVIIKRHEDIPYDKLKYPNINMIIDYYYRDRPTLAKDRKIRLLTKSILKGYFQEAKYRNSPEKAVRIKNILSNAHQLCKYEGITEAHLKAFLKGCLEEPASRRIFWRYDENRVLLRFRERIPDSLFKDDPFNPMFIAKKFGSEREFNVPPLPEWFYLTVEVVDMNDMKWTPIKNKIFGGQWSATISKELDRQIEKLTEELGMDFDEAIEMLLRIGLNNLPCEVECGYKLYEDPRECENCECEVYCAEKEFLGDYYINLEREKKLEVLKKIGKVDTG